MIMNLNNLIGGYFGLELGNGKKEYHVGAIRLNTGRNALEYILRAKNYRKIYLPFYTCSAILEPIDKLGLEYEFYFINDKFLPVFDFSIIRKHEAFVYVNYFGVCEKQIKKIASSCRNLILDNSQAFFSKPINGIDTFYSPRKFFGVPDGAYLYTDKILDMELSQDYSFDRFSHLIGRIDKGAQGFYPFFQRNEDSFKMQKIKKMSHITQRILQNIDYKNVSISRIRNFKYLHKHLKKINQLKLPEVYNFTPMAYPFLLDSGKILKKNLIQKKIFVATYWLDVKNLVSDSNLFELYLVDNLVPIPIDQRYNLSQMEDILKIIKKNI